METLVPIIRKNLPGVPVDFKELQYDHCSVRPCEQCVFVHWLPRYDYWPPREPEDGPVPEKDIGHLCSCIAQQLVVAAKEDRCPIGHHWSVELIMPKTSSYSNAGLFSGPGIALYHRCDVLDVVIK